MILQVAMLRPVYFVPWTSQHPQSIPAVAASALPRSHILRWILSCPYEHCHKLGVHRILEHCQVSVIHGLKSGFHALVPSSHGFSCWHCHITGGMLVYHNVKGRSRSNYLLIKSPLVPCVGDQHAHGNCKLNAKCLHHFPSRSRSFPRKLPILASIL